MCVCVVNHVAVEARMCACRWGIWVIISSWSFDRWLRLMVFVCVCRLMMCVRFGVTVRVPSKWARWVRFSPCPIPPSTKPATARWAISWNTRTRAHRPIWVYASNVKRENQNRDCVKQIKRNKCHLWKTEKSIIIAIITITIMTILIIIIINITIKIPIKIKITITIIIIITIKNKNNKKKILKIKLEE